MGKTAEYFNYRAEAHKYGFKTETVQKLERQMQKKYGSDRMMFELKMLKAIDGLWLLSRK